MKGLLRLYFTVLLLNLLVVSCIFFTKVIEIIKSLKTLPVPKSKHLIMHQPLNMWMDF